MGRLPTVTIAAPEVALGWMIINESDFDPKIHTLYQPGGPVVAVVEASGASYHVEQNGPWWTLYGPNGEKVGAAKRSREEVAAQAPEGATVEDR
jgi:hypothetical protein